MSIVRNHTRRLIWLPAIKTGTNSVGKSVFAPGPKGLRTKLKPGLNVVDDETLAFAKKHPHCKKYFEKWAKGKGGRKVMLSVEGKAEEKQLTELDDLNVEEARALIAEEEDEMKLVFWSERDARKGVQDALGRRIAELHGETANAAE